MTRPTHEMSAEKFPGTPRYDVPTQQVPTQWSFDVGVWCRSEETYRPAGSGGRRLVVQGGVGEGLWLLMGPEPATGSGPSVLVERWENGWALVCRKDDGEPVLTVFFADRGRVVLHCDREQDFSLVCGNGPDEDWNPELLKDAQIQGLQTILLEETFYHLQCSGCGVSSSDRPGLPAAAEEAYHAGFRRRGSRVLCARCLQKEHL